MNDQQRRQLPALIDVDARSARRGQGQPAPAGVLRSLFDFSFRSFVTPRLIRGVYMVSTAFYVFLGLLMVGIGLASILTNGTAFTWATPAIGLGLIISAPVAVLFGLLYVRVLLELVMVAFRIAELLEK